MFGIRWKNELWQLGALLSHSYRIFNWLVLLLLLYFLSVQFNIVVIGRVTVVYHDELITVEC
jgi:hypothetical protein